MPLREWTISKNYSYFFFKDLFIHLREREKGEQRFGEEEKRERERETQAM